MVLNGTANYNIKRGTWEDSLKNARPMTYTEKLQHQEQADLYQRHRNKGATETVPFCTKQEDELFWMDTFREMDAREKARYASGTSSKK
jgi:hypothetical protein